MIYLGIIPSCLWQPVSNCCLLRSKCTHATNAFPRNTICCQIAPATSVTGVFVYLEVDDPLGAQDLVLDATYVEGTPIASTATFVGESFDSLMVCSRVVVGLVLCIESVVGEVHQTLLLAPALN